MTVEWNLADLFELVADTAPDRLALAHGTDGVTRTWREFDARANALAAHLSRVASPGDKVSIYAYNRPEYVESLYGVIKARLVPVNVNYRYQDAELRYLFDNSDSVVVIYEAAFADAVRRIRADLPKVKEWIEIDDGSGSDPSATPFEPVASATAERPDVERSPEDLLFLYTGGTTGMPKGVMWEHRSLWRALGGGGNVALGEEPSSSAAEHAERVAQEGRGQRLLPGCPLMHGTGQFTAINALGNGGAIVTLPSRKLDAEQLWATVEARGVQALAIVGDVFAKPMVQALQEHAGRWDLSSCFLIVSSGVIWSPSSKKEFLEHLPHAILMDSFGSSEAVGFGMEITTKDSTVQLAKFKLGPNCKVFTPEGEEVQPGSGAPGFVARSGPIPVGYYKDEKKTAETFPTIQGRRWSIPGDWCTVASDGTLDLLGRGSVCINSGGEKIHAEEVEETLKTHEAIQDAVVVGLPDERWGESVNAAVSLRPGTGSDEQALRDHVRESLAAYKVPKRIVFVDDLGRSPSGKADYKAVKARVQKELGQGPTIGGRLPPGASVSNLPR